MILSAVSSRHRCSAFVDMSGRQLFGIQVFVDAHLDGTGAAVVIATRNIYDYVSDPNLTGPDSPDCLLGKTFWPFTILVP
jgi:hypothetical protein